MNDGTVIRSRTRRPRPGQAPAAPRERNRPLKVYVSADERIAIAAHAASASLTVSDFLRNLGLGYTPVSTLDLEGVKTLARVAGDQGRLGGLLKLWLSERPGEGGSEIDIAALLDDLKMVTAAVHKTLDRL